jgi:Fe-S cluster biogenesis protein NfuA
LQRACRAAPINRGGRFHHAADPLLRVSLLRQVRPYLMADGGNVEFMEIDGLVVKLKLQGACGSCPSSTTTMTMGIKRRLMEKIPVSWMLPLKLVKG